MNRHDTDRDLVVAALRHAAPYIRMYKRKTFVVKAGGEAFVDPAQSRALLEQIAILHQVGIRIVLVHGAGPQSTARAKEKGLETTMVQGRRVTDAATLAVSEEVNAEVRAQIAAICDELGMPTKGLVGAEGPVRATKRPPVEMGEAGLVDFGFVGDIDSIDAGMRFGIINQCATAIYFTHNCVMSSFTGTDQCVYLICMWLTVL